jgi:hypothetical protein
VSPLAQVVAKGGTERWRKMSNVQTKLIEIRESATCIIALATRVSNVQRADTPFDAHRAFLLGRVGWRDEPGVYLTNLTSSETQYDPHHWRGARVTRTMPLAHECLKRHWDSFEDGDVLDVEYHVIGVTSGCKVSEKFFNMSRDEISSLSEYDRARYDRPGPKRTWKSFYFEC